MPGVFVCTLVTCPANARSISSAAAREIQPTGDIEESDRRTAQVTA
jgi:hypothetical protein